MANTVETRIIEVKVTSTGEQSLKALQTQLDAVAKQYDKAATSTLKMNKAQQDADKVVRQNRTAYVGLGQQLQDSVVQLQMGTSALTVFTQQGSQAAFMLQGMGGIVGKFATFMSGPWGAAIFAATAVLGPFIAEMIGLGKETEKTNEAIDKMEEAVKARKSSEDDLRLALAKTKEAYRDIRMELEARARQEVNLTQVVLAESLKRLEAAMREREAIAGKIKGAGGGRASAEMATGTLPRQIANQRELAKAIDETREAVTEAEKATTKWNATRVDTINANKAMEDNKKETKKAKDEFAELLAAWREGGPELARLKKEFEDLKKVFKIIEGVDWTDTTANSSLLSKTLRDIFNQIRAAKSPIQAIEVEFENLTSETDKLNTRFKTLMGIVEDMTQDPAFRNWAADQAADIAFKLEPALKAVTDQVDKYYEDIRKATETSNAGGSKKQGLEDQKKKLEAQQRSGLLTPEGAKVVAEEMRKINVELAKMELSPAQLEGFNLLVETIDKMGEAFAQAIENGESLKKAFKEVAKSVVRELVKIIVKLLVIKALQAAFPGSQFIGAVNSELFPKAKGGAFVNGVQKFAKGGVVGAPTLFGMRGGLGVMGEAGPEAVMPLARGSDGKLGVTAAPVNIQIINNAGVAVSTRTEEDKTVIVLEAAEQARKMITSDIRRGGNPIARSIEGTYGVSRAR